jgi:hypothetical protein
MNLSKGYWVFAGSYDKQYIQYGIDNLRDVFVDYIDAYEWVKFHKDDHRLDWFQIVDVREAKVVFRLDMTKEV